MEKAAIFIINATLQFLAAYFTLKLVKVTGKRLAWTLLAAGLCVLGFWHILVPWKMLHGIQISSFDFVDGLVEICFSGLVLAGAIWINPLLAAIKRSEAALKESESSLRHLNARLMTVQERERQRLSKELHDHLGQSLLALKMHLSSVGKRPVPAGLKGDTDYAELMSVLNELINLVRGMYEDLCPFLLETLGLPAALRQLVRESLVRGEDCAVDVDEVRDLFSPETRVIIYRVLQEAISNISKYAGATRVALAASRRGGTVSFRLWDNGKGFRAEEVTAAGPGRGLGLAAMEERVRMLGGEFQVQSREGEGTNISFWVPTAV